MNVNIVGEVWSRKDYEYTIVSVFPHENTGRLMYVVKIRKFGYEEVKYQLMSSEFAEPCYRKEC